MIAVLSGFLGAVLAGIAAALRAINRIDRPHEPHCESCAWIAAFDEMAERDFTGRIQGKR